MEGARSLEGKVAIVTGASAGIGRAIALAYAQAGAKVVVASRTRSKVDALVEEIRAGGGEAIGATCDVGHRDQVFATVDAAVGAFGTVHVLVNNAQGFGTAAKPTTSPMLTPLEDFNEEEWDHTFRTGVTASLWGMKAVFPHMKRQGYGRIINLASSAGYTGAPGMAAYNATKEAIRALTRTAAREWSQHGITSNVLVPFLETASSSDSLSQAPVPVEAILGTIPMKRWGTAERDLAPLAVFIAGEGSGYITGMSFMVDGGQAMFP